MPCPFLLICSEESSSLIHPCPTFRRSRLPPRTISKIASSYYQQHIIVVAVDAMVNDQKPMSKSPDQLLHKCPDVLPGDKLQHEHTFKPANKRDGTPTLSMSTILGSKNRKQWEDLPMESLGAMLFNGLRITSTERDLLTSLLVLREHDRAQPAGGENSGRRMKDHQSSGGSHI
jgi:hypothetical protein